MTKKNTKEPTQRQLRFGEQVRHILAGALGRNDVYNPLLRDASITVAEVSVSPDLRHALAYVMPLGGKNKQEILDALNEEAPHFNSLVAKGNTTKFSPRVRFVLDETFENADHIENLLRKANIRSE